MWTELWTAIQPAIISVGGVVITAIFSFVGVYARQYLSDASMKAIQDIFQKGIENAAGIAFNKLDPKELLDEIKPNNPAVVAAIDYVKKAVPDTIGKFKLNDFDLGLKIIAKMMVLTAGAPPPHA